MVREETMPVEHDLSENGFMHAYISENGHKDVWHEVTVLRHNCAANSQPLTCSQPGAFQHGSCACFHNWNDE